MRNNDLESMGLSEKRILWALCEGRAYTINEIAKYSGLSEASVALFLKEGFTDRQIGQFDSGKRIYYFLLQEANQESLYKVLSVEMSGEKRIYDQRKIEPDLRYCRSCYHHLAGRVGQGLTAKMRDMGLLTLTTKQTQTDFYLTPKGMDFFAANHIPLSINPNIKTVKSGKACLDFSERRFHLGGKLGAVLMDYLSRENWIERTCGNPRSFKITDKGRELFKEQFDFILPDFD